MERRDALQQAIDEISRQRAEIERLRRGAREPIAVVGMACRFPGASTLDEYWDLLARGTDAITDVPRERWNADAFYHADVATVGTMATRQGGFIRGADQFDPQFFGIAPREAQHMDPQQRILLEVTWEALEHAGIAPPSLYGSATGVFVGITCFDHAIRLSQSAEPFNSYSGTGSALNMAPGRLSYVLGLTGPSMAVDTACSSSLVSLHLACQSLRDRETSMAIVGGVHLILSPHVMVSFSQARMLSGDGRSKTFDASADGYSRGEGCGVVVLKRYSDAVAHGDRVLGLIRGTAVNQDGPSGGLTVPNGGAQQQVIRRALDVAGVAPADVSYVEAHGTGTSLGDPIEVEAAAAVYGAGRAAVHPLLIGSVKTNIGHLEPAAGMAGLIKILLALEHGELPRHLHLRTPNPHIPWETLPVRVVVEPTAWPRSNAPRLAGLSAFGFSGTNAHVIVEEPPNTATETALEPRRCLLPLSAKSDAALVALARRYAEWLGQHPDAGIAAVAFTAGAGRAHFPHRLTVVAETAIEAKHALEAFADGRPGPNVRTARASNAGYRRDGAEVAARLDRAFAAYVSSNGADAALADIAAMYLEGVPIDWARMFTLSVPARLSLPTYPFERQRYWIETPDQATPAAPVCGFYELSWTAAEAAAPDLAGIADRRWVIVPGDPALADRISDLLREHRAAVSINDALAAATMGATDILFLAGAQAAGEAGATCEQLLALVHALAATGASPRVSIVTRGAFPVASAMTSSGVAQAPVAAFARVLGLEHPEWSGRVIDLDPSRTDPDDALVVLAEVLRADGEDQTAIRGGDPFVQRIERVTDVPRQALALHADATYLITGGLGNIGLLIAGELARRGARSLCLVGRQGVVTPRQREAIAAIEALGTSVRVAIADVADRASMVSLFASLESCPPLRGVVHAAGVAGYVDIEHVTADALAAVLRPKVEGGWNLHELTRHRALDFFVCLSSIASAWGSRGQAHYAAGNAYLDALAYLRRGDGLPSVTINWGPWVDGGMTSPEAEVLLRRVGVRALPTPDALAAFGAALQSGRPQLIAADIDWELFRGSYEARGHRRLLERLTPTPAPVAGHAMTPLAELVMQAVPAERLRLVIDAVQREVALVLELPDAERTDMAQGLFEMGLDSLMAVELRTRLQALTGRALPATLVFDYPNIRAIAQFVVRELDGREDDIAATPAPVPPPAVRETPLDALSDEDAEALLLKKLESLH